ncbi:MAG: hypothetical protein ABEH89_01180 [bacterium]
MRKKVFLIHGSGQQHDLGTESGGDLDTVSSNAFYGVWMEKLVQQDLGHTVTYGEDYEFDFLNYQQGLRQLDLHSGCDLYLPDFPIDALAPELRLHRLQHSDAVDERTSFYDTTDKLRRTLHQCPEFYPTSWKDAYNDLSETLSKYLERRTFHEIRCARLYTEMFYGAVREVHDNRGLSKSLEKLSSYLVGSDFENLKSRVADRMESDLKRDLVNELPQRFVEERLLLNDAAGTDYGRLQRLGKATHLLGPLVEGLAVVTGTYSLILEMNETLSRAQQTTLIDWCKSLKNPLLNHLRNSYEILHEMEPGGSSNANVRLMDNRCRQLIHFIKGVYPDSLHDEPASRNSLDVQVIEKASGHPVEDIDVVFNVTRGSVRIEPVGDHDVRAESVTVTTNERGTASVRLVGNTESSNYGVTATIDGINFITFPPNLKLTENYSEVHPDPSAVELHLDGYLNEGSDSTGRRSQNTDKVEEGTAGMPERALKLQQEMLRRHLRYLDKQDVRLIRIDDHHPYNPRILETLDDLRQEGFLETINLSSLPRGQHQPRDEQKCGAGLIYENFIEGTVADNEGLRKLRQATRVQDLHLEEDPMAVELSKLIGSRFSKRRMCKGLMSVDSERAYDSILRRMGWDETINEYERSLAKVLPRLGRTLHKITFVIPPEDASYRNEVGWNVFRYPLEFFTANTARKKHLLKSDYAHKTGRRVEFYASLSPYCDPDRGEPTINVASALNYLAGYYDMDYFLYAYGSFLLSTRRVNEDGYDIDLGRLVSTIGTGADGGHPGAATASPSRNPAFPEQRFDSINERNFTEYLFYLSDLIEDHTGLELLSVDEVVHDDMEPGVRVGLEELVDRTYQLDLRGADGVANIGVTRAVYTPEDKPDVPVPFAIGYLKEQYPELDYIFYSRSKSNLTTRNVSDERRVLNLDELAREIGTFRDQGHPRAACSKPRFNPNFPEEDFDYVSSENMREYVQYIGDRINEYYDLSHREITPLGG